MQVKSTLCGKSLEEIGDAFVKALYCVDVQEDAFINTAEFFMEKTTTAIYNSEGIDVSYEKKQCERRVCRTVYHTTGCRAVSGVRI
ncbi:MAG: hypothetical protein ACLR03_06090 [Roseburia inulinivorans]